MAEKEVWLSQEEIKKREERLDYLKTTRRLEIAEQLKVARAFGDLSENAEYDAAKAEQLEYESRIEEIEQILKYAEVVVEDDVDLGKVSIGCKVRIMDLEFKDEMDFKLVGTTEANSLNGNLSNESPVGKAILGHKVGDTVKVETKSGIIKYKILKIERSN